MLHSSRHNSLYRTFIPTIGLVAATVLAFALDASAQVSANLQNYYATRVQSMASTSKFTFAVSGDIHVDPGNTAQVFSPAQWQTVVTTWRDAGVKFGVIAGDLGYGASIDIDSVLAGMTQTLNAPPIFFAMGNHELDSTSGKRAWIDALYPGAVQAASWTPTAALPGDSDRAYWSFNVGPYAHFVFLDGDMETTDTARLVGQRIGATQLAWLSNDLQANRDKNLFVFIHEPIDQAQYDTPYYTLYDRGALLELLSQQPQQKYVFSGHLHGYRGQTNWKGVSLIHVSQGDPTTTGVRVSVDGLNVSVTWPSMTAPIQYDQHPMYQTQTSGSTTTLRVGEEGGDYGRTRGKAMTVVGAENGVQPTNGSLMLKAGPITWYDQYFISEQLVKILPGMKLSYDIYLLNAQPGMDAISVQPGWAMLNGAPPPLVADQNGITLSARPRDGSQYLYYEDLATLGGRASGAWYRRVFDLSPWAGHYIDGFVLGARAQAANVGTVYVDNIHLDWPSTSSTSCSYSVAPLTATFSAAGGTGSAAVTTSAGCLWGATSGASWVTVTAGATGTGSGTVGYSVGSNPYTTQRIGTLTVAGSTVTTTESGATTSPDGTTVPTNASQIVDANLAVWTIGGNAAILRNGVQAAGGYGSKIYWKNSTIYVLGTDNNWWQWTGSGWLNVGPTTPGGGSTGGTTSPDGTMVPTSASQIVDANGAIWTIGSNAVILRNGVQAAGGYGSKIYWKNSTIYVLGTDGNWWQWTGGGWLNVGPTTPGGAGTAPPTSASGTMVPTNASQIVDANGAIWTIGSNAVILRNGVQAAGGYGSKIYWKNSTIYVWGTDNNWWRWTGTGWVNIGSTQP